MEATQSALGKLIAKRRLEGGEFDFVLVATNETVSGKKSAFNLLKEKLPEEYEKFKGECIQKGESDESFEARVIKLIPSVAYEATKEEMDVDEEETNRKSGIEVDELNRLVSISNVDRKTKEEEVQTFLKKFDGIETVKKYFVPKFAPKNSQDKARRQFTGIYNVKFSDDASAASFLAKSDEEVTLNEKVLNRQLLKASFQNRVMRQQFAGGAHHKQRLVTCIPVDEDQLANHLLVYGIGKNNHAEAKEVFTVEAGYTGLTEVKCVKHRYAGKVKVLGYLLKFDSPAACEAVSKKLNNGEILHKEKELKCSLLKEAENNLAKKLLPNDLTNDSANDKQVVLLKPNRGLSSDELVEKVKKIFPKVSDVAVVGPNDFNLVVILSFNTAAEAKSAATNLPTEISSLINPCLVLPLTDYIATRTQIIEESKDRMGKIQELYKVIKAEPEIDGETITLINKNSELESNMKKEKAKEKKKENKEKQEPKKAEEKPAVVVPQNPLLAKRKNRGPGVFDKFVGVNGLATPIKNMGVASDIDICNYFIQNHKDVVDVKFLEWTKSVFVMFKSVEAAERFVGLAYVLFYGVELSLMDVELFYKNKKRTPKQKEDLASVLLGKKTADLKLRAEEDMDTQEQAATKGVVELAAFPTKQPKIRERFIEELNLNQQEVGQAQWVKDPKGFKATLMLKLDEDAISFLVKKWNNMNITVEGETVQAVLTNKTPGGGVKRGNRRSFGAAGKKKPKFNPENY